MSRRPFSIPILAAATFLLTACATSPAAAPAARTSEGRMARVGGREAIRIENESFTTSDLVDATPRRVWEALVATFHDLDLPMTEVDQDRGIVIGEGFRLRRLAGRRASYYVDRGSNLTGPVADQSYVTVTLSSVAHEASDVIGATSPWSARGGRLVAGQGQRHRTAPPHVQGQAGAPDSGARAGEDRGRLIHG